MRSYLEKIKAALVRFMSGRYGPDEFGRFMAVFSALVCLLSIFTGQTVMYAFGLVCWCFTIFRMFSRRIENRRRENRYYLDRREKLRKNVKAFFLRLKNRKTYKYFRCPKCRLLIRLNRHIGVHRVFCPRCGHEFEQKT